MDVFLSKKTLIFKIALFSLLLLGGGFLFYFDSNVEMVIENQLKALQQKKLAMAYYNFASKEFQSITSLSQFKEFIIEHPIFSTYTVLKINERIKEKNFASAWITLEDGAGDRQEILYEFIKEGFSWKIVGIHVNPILQNNKESSTAEMIAPIENQLNALKKNEVFEAYQSHTTNDFTKNTSFEEFRNFIIHNPLLTQFDHYNYQHHSIRGDHGIVSIILNPDKEAVCLEYTVKCHEDKSWKIQYMQIVAEASKLESDTSASAALIKSTVKQILEILKNKQYKNFYDNFISQDIKKENSLEKFEFYFKSNPVFSNYQSFNLKEPYIENIHALVIIELKNEEGVTVVEFSLKLEEKEWKITGIHVEPPPEATAPIESDNVVGFKSRDLLTVIQSFLTYLQNGEVDLAYQKLTSKPFQEQNSLEQFKEFIQKHSEMGKASSTSFEKLLFNNNIATLVGKLYLSNTLYLPVEFDLYNENDKWKILHIFTYPVVHQPSDSPLKEGTSESANSLVINKIIVGTQVNTDGSILDPSIKLSVGHEDLYINVLIQNGMPGDNITIVLRHVPSGSEIAPLATPLTEKGNNKLSFVFSPPPAGWPKGAYQLRVSSSTKVYKTFSFTME